MDAFWRGCLAGPESEVEKNTGSPDRVLSKIWAFGADLRTISVLHLYFVTKLVSVSCRM